jgi:hypothetical protein
MSEIFSIMSSWQFIVASLTVFVVMAFFNGLHSWKGIGYYLWGTKVRVIRKFLKFTEAVKVPCLFLLGFGFGWVPSIPRPEQLADAPQLSVALLYGIAGLCSMFIVKSVKKYAEARGIDIGLDLSPKEQKRRGAHNDKSEPRKE